MAACLSRSLVLCPVAVWAWVTCCHSFISKAEQRHLLLLLLLVLYFVHTYLAHNFLSPLGFDPGQCTVKISIGNRKHWDNYWDWHYKRTWTVWTAIEGSFNDSQSEMANPLGTLLPPLPLPSQQQNCNCCLYVWCLTMQPSSHPHPHPPRRSHPL